MTTDEQRAGWLSQLTREEPEVNRDVKNDVTKDAEEKKEELWKDDKLERRLVADALATLVKAQRRPFVVSLDGDWGTGKTFFLERWKEHLEMDGLTVIYFNAWKDDFFEDPLVPLLAEIAYHGNPELRKKISGYAKKLVYHNTRSLIAKHAGVDVPEFGDDITISYKQQTNTRTKLRETLTGLVQGLRSEHPLVLIVDELDRCRPDFAVATLERTKHVLDLPGLAFVYGVNRRQLCQSVASLYGNICADEYVRRFFDMEFVLPTADTHTYCSYLTDYYAVPAIVDAAALYDGPGFRVTPSVLRSFTNLSLRDIEQCIRTVAFVAINMAHRQFGFFSETVLAIVVIRLTNNTLYRRFARGEHVAGDMIDYLHMHVAADDLLWLSAVQGHLYALCDEQAGNDAAYHELQQFRDSTKHDGTRLLANLTKSLDDASFSQVIRALEDLRSRSTWGFTIVNSWHPSLVAQIELATGK